MAQAVTRLFDDHEAAAAAVRQLEGAGIPREDISLIAGDAEGRRDRVDDDDNDTAEGAGKGAATGGLIGGGAGLLAGLGMLAIPGLGPVVAVGWLAATAVGAAAGVVTRGGVRAVGGAGRAQAHPPGQFRAGPRRRPPLGAGPERLDVRPV